MKIRCECGHVISDQADYLTYKARFLADQDYFDLWEAVEQQMETLAADVTRFPPDKLGTEAAVQQAIMNATDAISKYLRRVIYQCPACGRLLVDDAHSRSHVFAPSDDSAPKNLLCSIEGERWKRPLRGSWEDGRDGGSGELWWGFGDTAEGCERYKRWEELRRRYFEVLASLREKDILRDAFLRRGKELFHQWP